MISNEKTGQRIKALMEENKVSVKDIEDACLVRNQAVYRWLNGKCLPNVDNLLVISRIFGIPMENIIVETE